MLVSWFVFLRDNVLFPLAFCLFSKPGISIWSQAQPEGTPVLPPLYSFVLSWFLFKIGAI